MVKMLFLYLGENSGQVSLAFLLFVIVRYVGADKTKVVLDRLVAQRIGSAYWISRGAHPSRLAQPSGNDRFLCT